MKSLSTFRVPLLAAIAAVLTAGSASATWGHWHPKPPPPDECVVKAYANDYNQNRHQNGSWNDDKFWSIDFRKAVCDDAYIKEVTIDLRAGKDHDAYFDLSGGDAQDWGFGPKIGMLEGLSASDITFTPNNGDTTKLTLTFKDGAFKAGDRIWFGADTDYLGDNNAASVGWKGVGFSVTFGGGTTVSTKFAEHRSYLSKATVRTEDCCPTVIPTPTAVGLGMLMLGGIAIRRRRSAD